MPDSTARQVAVVFWRRSPCYSSCGNGSRPGVAVVHQRNSAGSGAGTSAYRGGQEVGGKNPANGFDHGLKGEDRQADFIEKITRFE